MSKDLLEYVAGPLRWLPSTPGPAPLDGVRLPFDEQPHARAIEWWHFMGYVDKHPDPTVKSTEPQKRLSFVVSVLKARVRGFSELLGLAILIDHEEKDLRGQHEPQPHGRVLLRADRWPAVPLPLRTQRSVASGLRTRVGDCGRNGHLHDQHLHDGAACS